MRKTSNLFKKLFFGDINIVPSVEDVDIVDVYNRKDFNTQEKKLKSHLTRKYFDGSLIGVNKKRNKNIFAFQDILQKIHIDNINTKNKPLILLASSLTIQVNNDSNNYSGIQKTPVGKKIEVIRLFFGSSHKPFTEDYYGSFDIPKNAFNNQSDSTAYNNLSVRLKELFKYYSSINNEVLLLAPEKKVQAYFVEQIKNSKTIFSHNYKLLEEGEIKNIFNSVKPYQQYDPNILLKTASVILFLFAMFQVFTYYTSNKSAEFKKYEPEIKGLSRQIPLLEEKNKKLQLKLKDKKNQLTKLSQIYKEGMLYDNK